MKIPVFRGGAPALLVGSLGLLCLPSVGEELAQVPPVQAVTQPEIPFLEAAPFSMGGVAQHRFGFEPQRVAPYWSMISHLVAISGWRNYACSRDGTKVALWGDGNQVVFLDGNTGLQEAIWYGSSPVMSVSFSPDGKRAVRATLDGGVRIFEIESRKETLSLVGHQQVVLSALFSPDGTRVVTASEDRTAQIFDAISGKRLAALLGHTASLNMAQFSPDGKRVVTASRDGSVRLYNATGTGKTLVLNEHSAGVCCSVFSPDGKRVATASWDKTVRIWDATKGKELFVLRGHQSPLTSVAFSTDGTRLITTSGERREQPRQDNTARIWDVSTGEEVVVLRGHTKAVDAAMFSADGTQALTLGKDDTARIWDVSTGEEKVLLQAGDTLFTGEISQDNKRVVAYYGEKIVKVFDATTGKEIVQLEKQDSDITNVSLSPDSKWAVTTTGEGTVHVFDASTGKLKKSFSGHTGPILSVKFSPDGRRIITAGNDKTARVFDVLLGVQQFVIVRKEAVSFANFFPDGKRVITATNDRKIQIRTLPSEGYIQKVPLRESKKKKKPEREIEIDLVQNQSSNGKASVFPIRFIALSLDGKQMVVLDEDKTARIVEISTGKERVLRGHEGLVYSATFSWNGKYVVTTGSEGVVLVWDTNTGKPMFRLTGYGRGFVYASFQFRDEYLWALDDHNILWRATLPKQE